MATSSSNQGTSNQVATGDSYQIKGKSMKLEESQLKVQVENSVDFVSLAHHNCDLSSYLRYQDLSRYFTMLDGPSYENLVQYFWVRVEIYDKHAAKAKEDHMVLLNPELKGKSRAEMGLKKFKRTKIRSNVMGILITIIEEVIGKACKRNVEGAFQWNLNKKISDWIQVVRQSLLKGKKDGKYSDMEKEHNVLQKLMQECFLPKGGGVDQPSLEHKVFLHFLITFEKVNLPRYIFHHMLWVLEQSQQKNITFVPYGRLLSEIFHQGGVLNVLKMSKVVDDNQLGTVVGKYINGSTLYNMHMVKTDIKMDTDLQKSNILSLLMDNFPPICKQDPPDVRAHFVCEHWKATRETIKYSDIPDTMYSGALPIASNKRKAKKNTTSEADDAGEASEPKQKKAKVASKAETNGSVMPNIQQEVQDLEPATILNKRTRSGKSVGSSQSLPPQPSIPKKKRKHVVRKLKESPCVIEEEGEIEGATSLVTREVRRKRVEDEAALQKALDIAREIDVPVEVLLKESSVEVVHQVIGLTEELQQLVVFGDLLSVAEEAQKENVACSEVATSEATRGNTDSLHTANIIEIKFSSTSDSHLTLDIDNIPLDRVYANIYKSLSPSPSTKLHKKPSDETFEPMYPFVLERIGEMSQMRLDVCARLPADHPF